jgi:uncharacterized protein
LHISNGKQLLGSLYKGPVFENFIISEKIKQKENAGINRDFFFWRDKTGNEVDLITDNHKLITIAEIKSGETIDNSFWKTLYYFEKLFGKPLEKELFYGGKETQKRTGKLQIMGWQYLIE